MIRIFIVVFLVTGLAIWGADWVLDRPGTVEINWMGTQVILPIATAIAGHFLLVAVLLVGVWLVLWLLRAPRRIGQAHRRRRRERGYRALTLGMVAVAAGDGEEARKQARRAEILLDEPPLNMLLRAQSAQLAGDEEAARNYFLRLTERPETEFLGRRGLWMQATKAGNTLEALEHVDRALEIRPNAAWVSEARFDLSVRAGRWDEAVECLDRLERRKLIDPATAKRWRAVVSVELSRHAEEAGDVEKALGAARTAWRADPTLIPAAAQLARMYVKAGRKSRAEKAVREAWSREPHPLLTAAYREVVEGVAPEKRYRLLEKLASRNPTHPATHIALAEFAIDAELWDEARVALATLANTDPTVRACRLMADIELAQHGDAETARRWLARAGMARPDPVWVCRESGAVQAEWSAICRESGAFDSLEWRSPHYLPQPVLEAPLKDEVRTLLAATSARRPTAEQRDPEAGREAVDGAEEVSPDSSEASPTPSRNVTVVDVDETGSRPEPDREPQEPARS